MALPARLKRLLKSSPATCELADYLESEGVETPDETPTENDDSEDDESGIIHVTVTEDENHDNLPINQATVTVTSGGETYTGTTGSDGKCTISNVPAGECVIKTTAENYCPGEDNFTVVTGENTFTVELEKCEPQSTTNDDDAGQP